MSVSFTSKERLYFGQDTRLPDIFRLSMFEFFRRFRKRARQNVWSASAYYFDDILIVHANNRTYNNYGWNSQPVVTVSADAPRAKIGSIVRRVVSASRWDAEAPDPEGADSPILVASGASSWRKLERNSKLVHVSLELL